MAADSDLRSSLYCARSAGAVQGVPVEGSFAASAEHYALDEIFTTRASESAAYAADFAGVDDTLNLLARVTCEVSEKYTSADYPFLRTCLRLKEPLAPHILRAARDR